MIKLMKSTFYKEEETKKELCDFILSSDRLSMDKKCKEFESKFSEYQGRKYSILFNSGSSANLAIIQALLNKGELNKGDKVAFSALTWSTNVQPLIQLGLTPVAVDVSLQNLNVTSDKLLEVLEGEKIKAFFLTNALGFSGDIIKIRKICNEREVLLLEDNCESLGSEVDMVKLGNFGLASTFSFYVGHHLSTIEGGMVCTDDFDLHNELLMVRSHGWDRHLDKDTQSRLRSEEKVDDFYSMYTFYNQGYNLRPTEITGFIGVNQLKYAENICKKRSENFDRFFKASLKNSDLIHLKLGHMNFVSNFAFPLVFKSQEEYQKAKEEFSKFVEIRPIIGGSMVNQPFFKKFSNNGKVAEKCQNAGEISKRGFYIPNNPELTDDEVNLLCSLIEGEQSNL